MIEFRVDDAVDIPGTHLPVLAIGRTGQRCFDAVRGVFRSELDLGCFAGYGRRDDLLALPSPLAGGDFERLSGCLFTIDQRVLHLNLLLIDQLSSLLADRL